MPHHRLAIKLATLSTSHMIEEAAHVITYADSPFKAVAVALAALLHHRVVHTH